MSDNTLTPTQELIGDVLAARFRTGETMWTFDSRLTKSALYMQELGLIGTTHGIVEKTFRAWLTDAGKARFVSESYSPPMDKGGARARHVRNAEGFINKAVTSFNQRETDNYLRIAEVYATLALAEDGEKP
jgi:hypothetical protein